MLQRVGRGDPCQIGRRSTAKRSAGRRQNEAPHLTEGAAVEALVNRVVLAVHRQDRDAIFRRGLGDDAARHHQDFLVGEGNGLAQPDCGEHGLQRVGSTRRAQHRIGVRLGSDGDESSASAARDRDAIGRSRRPQPVDGGARCHGGDTRAVACDLFRKQRVVLAGRQGDHLQPIGVCVDDGKRAAPDRTGGAEDGDALPLQLTHT